MSELIRMNIILDRQSARPLIAAVAKAEVPPQVMWTGNFEGMKAQAEKIKEENFIEVLRVLKAFPWWEAVKNFVNIDPPIYERDK